MGKDIRQIVITGGPCGGKSTAVGWIQTNLIKEGWKVLVVPETATEFITGGVAPWTCGSNLDYQKCQMTLQLEKERLFRKAALSMPDEKILIEPVAFSFSSRSVENALMNKISARTQKAEKKPEEGRRSDGPDGGA